MLYLSVKLTFVQMYNIGVHLGHTLELSKFLSYWVYGGWRHNLFIINLVKTRVILKTMIETVQGAIDYHKPIWFINLDKRRGSFINRYAILAGEPYNSYYWISGTLTNFKSIFNWYEVLFWLLNTKRYRMRHRDKLKILGYFGFLNHRWRFPGMGFVSSTIASWKAVSEFWTIAIPCAAVVDSNTLSWNVSLPIAGNDDSLVCLNYYSYLVSINALYGKMWKIIRFRQIIKYKFYNNHFINHIDVKKKMLLIYLYNNRYELNHKYDYIRKHYIKEYEKSREVYDIIGWNSTELKFDMSVFSTAYSVLYNPTFTDFFGVLHTDSFDSEKDLIFYNDPYRLY